MMMMLKKVIKMVIKKKHLLGQRKLSCSFLKLYRKREHEFIAGLKRHNKLWSEIASELRSSNYNVSAVQVQNKMSSLNRTYKKIKNSNAKSGNHNNCWAYYSIMDSIFGDKD